MAGSTRDGGSRIHRRMDAGDRRPVTVLVNWRSTLARRLLFVDLQTRSLLQALVEPGPRLRIGTPTQVAPLPPEILSVDAMPDRQRFLALVPEHGGPGSITVVQGWRAMLEGQP